LSADLIPNLISNLISNFVCKKLGLILSLFAKHRGPAPRHFGGIRRGEQVVHRGPITTHQKFRDRQSLFRPHGNLAQRGIGAVGDPMQRHKTPILIFTVQSQSQHSENDPICGFVRVHGSPHGMNLGRAT
jgi:hypothetical protein